MVFGAAPRAVAHICTNPVEINVGEQVKLNVEIPSEAKPVIAVDIAIPKGFDLKDQIGYLGWVGTRVGDNAHFEGQTIKPYSCGYFTLVGTATKQGALFADITAHADDGTTTKYVDRNPYSPYPAFGIFAGVSVPEAGVTPGEPGGGTPIWVWLLIAVGAGTVAVGVAVLANRRRYSPVR